MKKLPTDFPILKDMYSDEYFPRHLVDKIADAIKEVALFLESGPHPTDEIQTRLDQMTDRINELEEEFEDNESELETVARDSIGETVEAVLKFYDVEIDIEEAIRNREW